MMTGYVTEENLSIDIGENESWLLSNEDDPVYNWGILTLSVLIIASAGGNILVCLAVCWEKRLQNMTNYFLMSLAIADLLVSILVMPLGLVVELYGFFPLSEQMCVIWSTMDILMCTASIWHMSTMSMDRYFTLKYPMKYGRNKTKTMVALKITFVWVVSISISSPICILGFMNYTNVYNNKQCVPTIRNFVIYGSFFAFYVPLTVMVVTYALTIKILCDNQKLMKNVVKQQRETHRMKDQVVLSGPYHNAFLTPNASYSRLSANQTGEISMSYCASINESSCPDMSPPDKTDCDSDQETCTDKPANNTPKANNKFQEETTSRKVQECALHTFLSVSQPNLFKAKGKLLNAATSQPLLPIKNGLLSPGPTLLICKRQTSSLKLPSSSSHPHLSPPATGSQSGNLLNLLHSNCSFSVLMGKTHAISVPLLAKRSERHHSSPVSCHNYVSPAHSQPHLPSMKRSRLLSSGTSNHSIRSLNSHKSITSIQDLESVKNFEGCISASSSLNSMLSRGSNGGIWSDFEEPEMLQRISQIENEMDECLFEKELQNGDCEVFEELESEATKSGDLVESGNESDTLRYSHLLKDKEPIPIKRCSQGDCQLEMSIPPVTISSPPVSSRNSMDSFGGMSDSSQNKRFGSSNNNSMFKDSLSPAPSSLLSIVIGPDQNSKSSDEDREKESTDELLSETLSHTTQNTVSTFHRYSPRMPVKLNLRSNGYASAWKTFLRRKKSQTSFKMNEYCHTVISKRTATNEKKASKVLGIIFAVFVTLWTPFFIVNVISVVCESCMASISPPMMASIVWLGYLSSLANPIIYTMFNTSFRKAFYRILTCQQQQKKHTVTKTKSHIESHLLTTGTHLKGDRRHTITVNGREM